MMTPPCSANAAQGKKHTPFAEFVKHVSGWSSKFEVSLSSRWYCDAAAKDEERFQLVDGFMRDTGRSLPWSFIPEGKSDAQSVAARNGGNALFAQRKWQPALEKYNNAVCFAPVDDGASTSLALAYANRSAVYFWQKRYLECVQDVDQACKYGYPREKLGKLLMRKAKSCMAMQCYADTLACLHSLSAAGDHQPLMDGVSQDEVAKLLQSATEALKSQEDRGDKAPVPRLQRMNGPLYALEAENYSLAGGPHDVFPLASARIGVATSPEGGRLFVATENISAGDVLLKEPFFVNAIFEHKWRDTCVGCSVWTDNLTPCNTCPNVVFCSLECASGERAKLHRKECSQLGSFSTDGGEQPVRTLAMQIVFISTYRTFLMKSLEEWRILSNSAEHDKQSDPVGMLNAKHVSEDLIGNMHHIPDRSKQTLNDEHILCGFGAWFVVNVLERTPGYREMDSSLRSYLGGLALRNMKRFSWNLGALGDIIVQVPPTNGPLLSDVAKGFAMFPAAGSFFGGSCYPNAEAAAFGDIVVMRALQPIKKGDPLTIKQYPSMSYCRTPKQDRIFGSLLSSRPTLICNCQACEEDWPCLGLNAMFDDRMRIQCTECSQISSFHLADIMITEGRTKCLECGLYAFPGFDKILKFMMDSGFDQTTFSTEDDLQYLFGLFNEAAPCLPAPNVALGVLNHVISSVWGQQGNKCYVARD